jgi:DMSO/TMAO reductase YedYZ heme-binding membrane subunit
MGPFSFDQLDRHRHRRVAELIGILWLLGLVDLCFTLWAHFFTPFHELNPVASFMLNRGLVPSLILFKLVVTAIGSLMFWRVRQHGRAELALWGVVGVYVLLAVRWSTYTVSAMQ